MEFLVSHPPTLLFVLLDTATEIHHFYSITSFNVVIAVLSMFILLVKSVMYVTHTWIPILSAIVHFILLVLYATSVGMQASRDVSDAKHPQRGAPWYLTKSCNVVHNKSNYGYCQQAKAAFGVTVCML